jgi:hypothetical protein
VEEKKHADVPDPPSVGRSSDWYSQDGVPHQSRIIGWGDAPICYGIEGDLNAEVAPGSTFDLCSITLKSAQACAPGWSVDDVATMLCEQYEACTEHTVDSQLKRLADVGAVQQDYPQCNPLSPFCTEPASSKNAWVLPAGWDKLSELKADANSNDDQDDYPTDVVLEPTAFYGFNLAFLVVGIVGWIALILGLVFGIVFGGGDAEEK